MFKKIISIPVIGLLFIASLQAAELKIGFVNVPKIMEAAPQAESAQKELEREFSPRQKRLVAEQKEIKKLEEQLSRDGAVMSESERRKFERNIISKRRDLKRTKEEFSEDVNIRRNEVLGKLQKEVFETIQALGKEESFDLLLFEGVIYASAAVDVTEKVRKRLTESFKGSK